MLDALIVGQGIVGSLLAMRLLSLGKRVMVVDDFNQSSASSIAAGMMNPVSGMRLKSLWETKDDRSFVIQRYRELEAVLSVSFLDSYPLFRALSQEQELAAFHAKSLNACSDIFPVLDIASFQRVCDIGQSQFLTPTVYRVRMPVFLSTVRKFLDSNHAYIQTSFDYSDLDVCEKFVSWNGLDSKFCVFCEGSKVVDNPYFQHLDWLSVLGDILTISCSDLPYKTILNHGNWLCPVSKDVYQYGATSYWEDTFENRQLSIKSLEDRLSQFLKVPYRILSHSHGVRATLRRREPIAQRHPFYPSLAIVNGMGGTGVSQTPLIVESFVARYFS